jgi:hypothetical protein
MAFRFRLFDVGGTDLGTFATSEPNWSPGHRIHRGPGDALEVVHLVAAEDGDDVNGYLVVAAVAKM